jgi:hypothetical protein
MVSEKIFADNVKETENGPSGSGIANGEEASIAGESGVVHHFHPRAC